MAVNKSACTQSQDVRNVVNSSNDSSDENECIIEDASSKEGEYYLNVEEDQKEETSVKNDPPEILPSKISDREYIYMPQFFENFEEKEEWKSSGKWLLYVHGQQEKLDYLWINLQPLLANGTLICLKSSTAIDTTKGILMCYTSNCEDRKDVKKAANAIRSIFSNEELIYYKTNEASDSGLYNEKGDKCISKYMNSVAGSLYERDEYNRWKKIFLDSDDEMNDQLKHMQI